jgi:ABC-2 type transport system permease protein
MPTVFQVIADWNPLSAVTAAARYLWANPNPSGRQRLAHAAPGRRRAPVVDRAPAIFAPLAARLYRYRTSH